MDNTKNSEQPAARRSLQRMVRPKQYMLNNKKIIEVWFPGEGNSHNTSHRLGFNGVTEITYITQSIGSGCVMDWIVVEQGHLTRKIRPEQITEVVWA